MGPSGENHGKAAALAWLAGHFCLPAGVLADLLDDRKADASARFARRFGALGAAKLLEDLAHFLGVHADALILNREAQMLRIPVARHRNLRVGRRVFYGVGEQIV